MVVGQSIFLIYGLYTYDMKGMNEKTNDIKGRKLELKTFGEVKFTKWENPEQIRLFLS